MEKYLTGQPILPDAAAEGVPPEDTSNNAAGSEIIGIAMKSFGDWLEAHPWTEGLDIEDQADVYRQWCEITRLTAENARLTERCSASRAAGERMRVVVEAARAYLRMYEKQYKGALPIVAARDKLAAALSPPAAETPKPHFGDRIMTTERKPDDLAELMQVASRYVERTTAETAAKFEATFRPLKVLELLQAIDRLTERCAAYKGQIEAGAMRIKMAEAENVRLAKELEEAKRQRDTARADRDALEQDRGEWTGKPCKTCGGSGERGEDSPGSCGACAGTGDEWMTWQARVGAAEAALSEARAEGWRQGIEAAARLAEKDQHFTDVGGDERLWRLGSPSLGVAIRSLPSDCRQP